MDPLLFGSDPEEKIISGFQVDDRIIRVYKKIDGEIKYEDREFYPFFFLSDSVYIDDFHKKFWIKKLNGKSYYHYVCAFHNWAEMKEAYHFVIDSYKKKGNGDVKDFDLVLLKNDPVSQYLTQYGKTLFKGLQFEDLYRIQMDVSFIKSTDSSEKTIEAFYLSDNKGWTLYVSDKSKSEKEKIEEFIATIQEKNPDLIEGFQLYNIIFPILMKKCTEYGITLNIGRDKLEATYIERITITEYEIEKYNFVIPGRHIVDLYDLIQSYDNLRRSTELTSVEGVAKALNLSKANRVSAKGIKSKEEKSPTSKQYYFDNCYEINRVSEKLLPGIFILNRMIPYNLHRLMKLNQHQKIESIVIREYLKQRQAMPKPEKIEASHQLINEIFYTGILSPIINAEIVALYSFTMLKHKIFPESDVLKIFEKLLDLLFNNIYKLPPKDDAPIVEQAFELPEEHIESFYSLINAFPGYISSSRTIFNSNDCVNKLYPACKEAIDKLVTFIKNSGGIAIELDSDEVYFIPPRDIIGEEMEKNYISILTKKMADFAPIKYKTRYRRMLSYKKKNHAFLSYDNKIKVKGSYLISKSMERFSKRFIYQCIDFMLNNRFEEIHILYNKLYKEIIDRKMDISEFQRTEILKESLKEYKYAVEHQGRNKSVFYQLALASGKNYKPGDSISYYVITEEAAKKRNAIDYETAKLVHSIAEEDKDNETKTKFNLFDGCENVKPSEEWDPNFRDENIVYYISRLDEVAQKFQVYFSPEDFKMMFSPDDLFVYSFTNIKVMAREVGKDSLYLDREPESIIFV